VLLLTVPAGARSAAAAERDSAWAGGANRVSAIEREATGVASGIAGSNVTVECADPGDWRVLGSRDDFDPTLVWGLTLVDGGAVDAAARRTTLAPRTCRLLAAFAASPSVRGTRVCVHPTAQKGASQTMLGECDSWGATLVAVHVLTHETMHLAGVVDEAVADCLAMQLDAVVARGLGASPTFGATLARDYWSQYYGAQDASYRSPDCRNRGRLDVFPNDAGWPTPRRTVIAQAAVAAFLARSSAI